tara:strand:+ start:413 stop:940 length:528 start_codon:yes stop_codon:yes gene_type:complete
MPCTITTGRALPCKTAFGGIKTIYFADFGGLTAVTFTDGKVSAFTGSVAGWTKWSVKGSSSLETTVTSSRENGTTFYTQTLNATFTFLDALTQNELQIVAVGRPYVAVEDYYGNVFLCGFENGMELTSGTTVTGAAPGDLSGFTIVMEGMEESAPLFLASAALLTPIDSDIIVPN